MTKFPDKKHEFIIEITDQEWERFSIDSKILMLYRLRQLKNNDMKQLIEQLGPVIEHEIKESEIDFDKTFRKRYEEKK